MKAILLLASSTLKSGVFSKGTKKGQPYSIAINRFENLAGQSVSRISPNVAVSQALKGTMVEGEIKKVATNPYAFKNAKGEDVTASSKLIVQFTGETEEQAIFAHGRQPLGYVAKTAVPALAGADSTP